MISMSKKHIAIILSISAFLLGSMSSCTNSQPDTAATQNSGKPASNSGNSLTASSHSAEKPASSGSTNSTNSTNSGASPGAGSPMAKPVDVSEMTAKIEKAEKAYKAKSTDAKLKQQLAAAYFERAFALTQAAQYRAALGDFRKGLKLDPNSEDAKDMHDRIIKIFKSFGREPPKEGEEPPPMPANK